jgi:hypothetical protein
MKVQKSKSFGALSLGLALVSGASLVACSKSEPSNAEKLANVEACYRSVAVLNKNYALDAKNAAPIVVSRSEGSELPSLRLVSVLNGKAYAMTLDGVVDSSNAVVKTPDGMARRMRIEDRIEDAPMNSSLNSLTAPINLTMHSESVEAVMERIEFFAAKDAQDPELPVVVEAKEESEYVAAESLMASLRQFQEKAKQRYVTHLSDPLLNQLSEEDKLNQLSEEDKKAAIEACSKVETFAVATVDGTRVGYSGSDVVRELKGE